MSNQSRNSYNSLISHSNPSFTSDEHVSYDLNETDWVYLSDFLDTAQAFKLHSLSASSNGSSWVLKNRSISPPWVILLHSLDDAVANLVINMVSNGMLSSGGSG